MKKCFVFSFLLISIFLDTKAQVFSSSNLPIVIINTNGNFIYSDPKVIVSLSIKYNINGARNYITDPDSYSGSIGIETRGSSSGTFAKQSYGFETLDINNKETDTSLLGLPGGSDWILNASHSDKTFLRNILPHYMYQLAGNYSPRSKPVELIIDNTYKGVYILQEKIKRDKNRVNIANLKTIDTTGVELTGGYILKSDKQTGGNGIGFFLSNYKIVNAQYNYGYTYENPSSAKITTSQQAYIKSFVDSAEDALYGNNWQDATNGYRNFFNTETFIDYIIVNEFAKNPDTYILSTYFYKPKDTEGRKFCMGPVWDFDLGFKNSYYFDADIETGIMYEDGNRISLFKRMMDDTSFERELKCKWQQLRATTFSNASLVNWVDSMAASLQEAQTRNFNLWPVLGQNVYYNSFPYPLTYNDEIDTLKQWLIKRGAWLDNKWNVNATTCTPLSILNANTIAFNVFPNPAFNKLLLICAIQEPFIITIQQIDGKIIRQIQGDNSKLEIDINTLENGFYFISILTKDGLQSIKSFIKK